MAPGGGDGRATLVALAIGLTIGMSVAGAGMLLALALTVGTQVLGPTLRALAVGAPVALLVGLCARILSARIEAVPASIAVAVVSALAAACLVMGACAGADRRLLNVLRSGTASTDSIESLSTQERQ